MFNQLRINSKAEYEGISKLEGVIEYWKRRNTVSIDGMATGIFDGD